MSAFVELEKAVVSRETVDSSLVIKAMDECKALLWQYRDDMRHQPAPDSKARRIQAINAVLGDQ